VQQATGICASCCSTKKQEYPSVNSVLNYSVKTDTELDGVPGRSYRTRPAETITLLKVC